MKKIALALVISTATLGDASASTMSTGFYIGATGGFGATTGKYTSATSALGSIVGSTDIGGTEPNLGIIGGYGWVNGCLYVGGEVGYSFENMKINSTLGSPSGSFSVKRNGYFDAGIRAGYLFAPSTLMYLRFGIHWGRWVVNDTLSNGVFAGTGVTGKGSKNALTLVPGIGVEMAIRNNVYARLEYVYEFGPSVTATNENSAPGAFSKASIMRSQSVKVGLAYKF